MLQSSLMCLTFQVETARAWSLSWTQQLFCLCPCLWLLKVSCMHRQLKPLPFGKLRIVYLVRSWQVNILTANPKQATTHLLSCWKRPPSLSEEQHSSSCWT